MNFIFHIGYHKTGTTYLQNNVFPHISGISFIPRSKCPVLLDDLINEKKFDLEKTLKLLDPFIHHESVLISFEGLVGNPFYPQADLAFKIAQRITSFRNVHVLVSIRNQVTLLDSLYRQYIQQGGVEEFKSFIDDKNGIFRKEYCEYHKLIFEYQSLIGQDSMTIITQESLLKNQTWEISRILKVLDVTEENFELKNSGPGNISMSNLSIDLMRFTNQFSSSNINGKSRKGMVQSSFIRNLMQHKLDPWIFSRISQKRSYLEKELKEEIRQFYFDSNKVLDNKFGLGLKELGYY